MINRLGVVGTDLGPLAIGARYPVPRGRRRHSISSGSARTRPCLQLDRPKPRTFAERRKRNWRDVELMCQKPRPSAAANGRCSREARRVPHLPAPSEIHAGRGWPLASAGCNVLSAPLRAFLLSWPRSPPEGGAFFHWRDDNQAVREALGSVQTPKEDRRFLLGTPIIQKKSELDQHPKWRSLPRCRLSG